MDGITSVRKNKFIDGEEMLVQSSSAFSGGRPHGWSILWRKLNLTLALLSFSATAKNSIRL